MTTFVDTTCSYCVHCREVHLDQSLIIHHQTNTKFCLQCLDYFLSIYTFDWLGEFDWTDKLSIFLSFELGQVPPEFCKRGTKPGTCAEILARLHSVPKTGLEAERRYQDHLNFLAFRGEFQDFDDWAREDEELRPKFADLFKGEGITVSL